MNSSFQAMCLKLRVALVARRQTSPPALQTRHLVPQLTLRQGMWPLRNNTQDIVYILIQKDMHIGLFYCGLEIYRINLSITFMVVSVALGQFYETELHRDEQYTIAPEQSYDHPGVIVYSRVPLDFKLRTDNPYLPLSGELWGVYYESFEENWPCMVLQWHCSCISGCNL